jgi:DNA-binding MarR family transcriptional regulator
VETSIEDFIFEFIDQCKLLFFPEKWNNSFMDYSKNEVFALLFVYRKGHANMTEIADYLGVPLNTATGIISRLEKRNVIKRERDIIDKRVVTIAICQEGIDFLNKQLKIIEHYYNLLMGNMSEEEKMLLIRLAGRFIDIVSRDLSEQGELQEDKKRVKKITIE